MKKLLLIVSIVGLTSCNELVQNSNSSDDLRYAYASLQGGNNFRAAVPAIIQKCAGCHQHEAWYGYDEIDYQREGLVVFSVSLSNSPFYYRLSNAREGNGPRNMPQGGGAAFTDEELQLVEDWINGGLGS